VVFLVLALWPTSTQRHRVVQEVEIEYIGNEMRGYKSIGKSRRRIMESNAPLL